MTNTKKPQLPLSAVNGMKTKLFKRPAAAAKPTIKRSMVPNCRNFDNCGCKAKSKRAKFCAICFKKQSRLRGAKTAGNAVGNPGHRGNASGNPGNRGNASGNPGNRGNTSGFKYYVLLMSALFDPCPWRKR